MTHGDLPIRGVNLGGWLVLERWITPQLFDKYGEDNERDLLENLGHDAAQKLLAEHRNTFITPDDFRFLADRGFNSVRLPVPWFILDETGHESAPFIGGIEYVDRCMEYASQYGLSVLLDLHSAPGGQNSFKSSTSLGIAEWHLDERNRVETLAVLGALAQRYKDEPALFGIELLNEPVLRHRVGFKVKEGIPAHYLRNFYRAGYQLVRKYLDSDKAVVLHDAFSPQMWGNFMATHDYENVWLDLHRYHCMSPGDSELHKGKRLHDAMKADRKAIEVAKKGNKRVMVGEWSCGLSIPQAVMTPEGRSAFERVFVRRQLREFQEADGWYFWTYKCDNDLFGWDSRRALAFLEKEMLK